MIISRTPFRVSFFGGGTDYPAWYRSNGGAVIGSTIDKYCYISVRWLPPFFEHRHRIVYSVIETVNDVANIKHSAVRAVLSGSELPQGIELHHDGDLPARSGLGSSSAFTVGLVHAMEALRGRRSNPQTLADEAIRIERDVLKESVGSQDQVFAAYGGVNVIHFRPDDTFDVQPLIMLPGRREELENSLVLVFTGIARNATEVARRKIDAIPRREGELRELRAMVDRAAEIISNPRRSLDDFGRLLDESWRVKRSLVEGITNSVVDDVYDKAKRAGAIGGKVLGAGGGGFMMLYVPLDGRRRVIEALSGFTLVDIRLGSPGTRIIVCDPQ